MKQRKALVVGASGLTGGHCLSRLLDTPVYGEVRVLGRRPLGVEHPRLREYIIDFDRPETWRDHLAVNDVYCCLGTTMKKAGSREAFYRVDYDYPVGIAREASKKNADRFLAVSAIGADPGSRVYYSRVKGEMENAVRAFPFRAVHIFRPSLLLGARGETRILEGIGRFASRAVSPLMIGMMKKYRPIEAGVLAWAMVRAAIEDREGTIFESHEIQQWFDRRGQAPG